MWNREPSSPAFGSFDRPYWGWKYKDFSDATLQYAVKLAVEYAQMRNKTATIPALLKGYVAYCKSIQLKDGSFNQCYPFERTPGVIYDVLSTFLYVRNSPYLVCGKSRADLDGIIERGIGFALKTDERHGAIANHFIQYAYELLHYASYAKDERAKTKGKEYLERGLSLFDHSEGWFLEYQGPDTGYQTRTLRYLVKIALLLDAPELWSVVRKAADFVGHMLMPDGSIHPMLGCRSTALLYPSAFETLAARDATCQRLAARIRQGWNERRVPLPSCIDFCNAIRLADDAFDAAKAWASNRQTDGFQTALPEGDMDFPKAGFIVKRSAERVVYVGHKLGGVVVAYAKDGNGQWKLIYEDSGYLLSSHNKAATWVTRIPDSGRLIECRNDSVKVQAGFYRSLHDEMTPAGMVFLRLLNLTILRLQWMGDLFRRVVVRHLISGRTAAPMLLHREVTLTKDTIRISDAIQGNNQNAGIPGGTLYRCRRIVGAHMASSRYFQEQELETLGLDWMEEVPHSLGIGSPHVIEIETGR
jgi:hypothetical protein